MTGADPHAAAPVVLDVGELEQVAGYLRAMVAVCPPRTARDRALARRVEGAAAVLGAVAARSERP